MKNEKKTTLYLVQGAVICAIYVVLFYAQELLLPGSGSFAIQFRVSEALTVLTALSPAAIPGLTIGCFLCNILNAAALPIDMVFGTIATFLAAITSYKLRNIKLLNLPVLSAAMPAVFNGLIIGAELTIFLSNSEFSFLGFLTSALFVAIGELSVCFILGLPLYKLTENIKIFKN